MGNKDYQSALSETEELLENIEKAKVRIQFLEIQVTVMQEANEFLNQRKDDLIEERKLAE